METLIFGIVLFLLCVLEFHFYKKIQDRYFEKLERAITNALINGSRK